ncbi:hypothetical protein FQR65_LT00157 [Abscondita terminalis]|nr:hypothetical protein FQR65_LT00157 [Abscondita terminalis]
MNVSHIKILIKSASQALNNVIREKLQIGAARAPQYVNHVRDEIIVKKVTEANNWYTKVIGLDEVKLHQQRVLDLQERLLTVQEKRREVGNQLAAVRKKSNELQDQLHKVKRQEDLQRFLDLMREETEILKTEMEVTSTFNNYDREEREIFTAFTNAVKVSHEKQRAQLEYTKYFGIILSILGSFLVFCYSTLRKRDVKKYIDERLNVGDGGLHLTAGYETKQNQSGIVALRDYIAHSNDLTSLVIKNQKELLSALDKSDILNVINKNHREMMRLVRAAGTDKKLEVPEETELISNNYLIYGGVAVFGYIILKIIMG